MTRQIIDIRRLTDERLTQDHPELKELVARRNEALCALHADDVDMSRYMDLHAAAKALCLELRREIDKHYAILV